jgi:hypothetical protein
MSAASSSAVASAASSSEDRGALDTTSVLHDKPVDADVPSTCHGPSRTATIRVITVQQNEPIGRECVRNIKAFMAHSEMHGAQIVTPYAGAARFLHSLQLDDETGRAEHELPVNRDAFRSLAAKLAEDAAAIGVPDCNEMTLTMQLLAQAHDVYRRALLQATGTSKGVAFEKAVEMSVMKARATADATAEAQRQWEQMSPTEKAEIDKEFEANVLNE